MKRPDMHCVLHILVFAALTLRAQDKHEHIAQYLEQVRNGMHPVFSETQLESATDPGEFEGILPYLQDSVEAVKSKAYELVYRICIHSPERSVREAGIEILLQAAVRRDAEMTGVAIKLLTKFNKKDFSDSAKVVIRNLVNSKSTYLKDLVKISGFLEMRDLIPRIREFSQGGNPPAIRWAAIISLSRMSDEDATKEVMRRIEQFPVNDDLIYQAFPDLIFTRQMEPIKYMIRILHSDEKHCRSADAEKEVAIPCGYRIMELLAPVIEGFPLEMGQTGDLRTNDYKAALQMVRQWFLNNKPYRIMTDLY